MKVWLLFFENFQGEDDFVGVYSSKESAQKKVAKYDAQDQRQFRIEESTLDE